MSKENRWNDDTFTHVLSHYYVCCKISGIIFAGDSKRILYIQDEVEAQWPSG